MLIYLSCHDCSSDGERICGIMHAVNVLLPEGNPYLAPPELCLKRQIKRQVFTRLISVTEMVCCGWQKLHVEEHLRTRILNKSGWWSQICATSHTYNLSTGYLGKSTGGILKHGLPVCLQCQVPGHQGLHSEMLCPQT